MHTRQVTLLLHPKQHDIRETLGIVWHTWGSWETPPALFMVNFRIDCEETLTESLIEAILSFGCNILASKSLRRTRTSSATLSTSGDKIYGNTWFDWPTDRLCPSQSHDTDTLQVPMLPHHAMLVCGREQCSVWYWWWEGRKQRKHPCNELRSWNEGDQWRQKRTRETQAEWEARPEHAREQHRRQIAEVTQEQPETKLQVHREQDSHWRAEETQEQQETRLQVHREQDSHESRGNTRATRDKTPGT